ncbi:hypothetical protein [Shewanella ulleungensis]|jgi:hypothetical protein|uniref:Uncharacterized protein n=1 Tax=Shewanella ulleungensis TaxID=2282699 RepID=A0ABQ2QJ10_9GAMM|nr:hypothetical protein [Shewanella ulleungensis]MCL1151702.1 hypothetical protein [Shewanella ulleungensis]GGP83896.1 hypothetical protein GCM10009410_16540 [Shewanella ulleungensis]
MGNLLALHCIAGFNCADFIKASVGTISVYESDLSIDYFSKTLAMDKPRGSPSIFASHADVRLICIYKKLKRSQDDELN